MRIIKRLISIGVATGSLIAGNVGAAIPDAERAVLEDFYVATGGDNWNTTTANLNDGLSMAPTRARGSVWGAIRCTDM